MTANIVAVGNLKGGVGKTTCAVNLAAALAEKSRVALIDADEQATAAEWIGAGKLAFACHALPLEAKGEREAEREAARWIGRVRDLSGHSDFLLIDLPPNLGTATAAALILADLLVLPVTPSSLDLRAAGKALDMLREARRERGGDLPRCLLLPSRVDRRTASGREVEAALHELGEPVGPAIGQRAAFVDTATANEWIGSYAPQSIAHQELATLAAVVRRLAK